LDFRIASLEGLSEADDDPADALPEIPAGPPTQQTGRPVDPRPASRPVPNNWSRPREAAQAQREKWRLARVAGNRSVRSACRGAAIGAMINGWLIE